jgi:hypothetical protein
MAKKQAAVAANVVDFVLNRSEVKAWQFNSVEQLEADIKKSRIKAVTFEVSATEVGEKGKTVTRIRLADGMPVNQGEWIVYWSKDKHISVFPEKFFKKHFADAALANADEEPSEDPAEKASEAVAEPTLTVRNADTHKEAVLADDGKAGRKIVLEESNEEVEAAGDDVIAETRILSFASAIKTILDGEGSNGDKHKEIKNLMKDLDQQEKHSIGARVNSIVGRRVLADGKEIVPAAPKKKPNERIPGRATAHLIPAIIVNRRVSVLH